MLSKHGDKPRVSNYIKKFISWRWLCIILFFTVTFSTIASAQITTNPIPAPIVKSCLAVGLQEIVKIPDSGSADQPSAQLNLLGIGHRA